MKSAFLLSIITFAVLLMSVSSSQAEIKSSSDSGFYLVIQRDCDASALKCEEAFLKEVGQWWLADHTYSLSSKNMSFNMESRCMEETLADGGFVRHMEIKQYHPGKRVILTGGMGPLQEMGLGGAMTIQWRQTDPGKCQVTMTYVVSGYSPNSLKPLATVVDKVLSQQMDSFQKFVGPAKTKTAPSTKPETTTSEKSDADKTNGKESGN